MKKGTTAAFWVVTAFLAFSVLSGGLAEALHNPGNVEGILRLGYPLYFITFIGIMKILGGIAILVPRFPRLKEWAYAGIFFNMIGAAVSHASSGDAPWHIVATLAIALLTLASWALRPADRRLGSLIPSSGTA